MVRLQESQLFPLVLTSFSGGFYDFTADLASKDTAYTALALQAHTDTTYFSDPAGLQMFHLLSHTDGSGGESLLVDGFSAARILQKESPASYDVLSSKRIRNHASGNEGISIQPLASYPVFNRDSDHGLLYQIRWNTSDRATMDSWQSDELLEQWYEAAWKWSEILRRPQVEYWEQLQPGKPLSTFRCQDTGALLTSFKFSTTGGFCMVARHSLANGEFVEGTVSYHRKGEIIAILTSWLPVVNYDDYISRYRMTNVGRGEVLQQL